MRALLSCFGRDAASAVESRYARQKPALTLGMKSTSTDRKLEAPAAGFKVLLSRQRAEPSHADSSYEIENCPVACAVSQPEHMGLFVSREPSATLVTKNSTLHAATGDKPASTACTDSYAPGPCEGPLVVLESLDQDLLHEQQQHIAGPDVLTSAWWIDQPSTSAGSKTNLTGSATHPHHELNTSAEHGACVDDFFDPYNDSHLPLVSRPFSLPPNSCSMILV